MICFLLYILTIGVIIAAIAVITGSFMLLNNDVHNIALTIQRHRKAAKLSQRELADLAGVGKTVVFDIEHGKSSVQLDTLLKILNILNIKFILKGPL